MREHAPTVDLDDTCRRVYRYLRDQPNIVLRAQATQLAKREYSSTPTTFIVARDGTCLPYNRAAFLADLRTLLLRNHPVGFVARFDR